MTKWCGRRRSLIGPSAEAITGRVSTTCSPGTAASLATTRPSPWVGSSTAPLLSVSSAVGRSGSTILFVSHNMPAVESLCTRAILLDKGKVAHDGGVRELVAEYHRRILETQGEAGANLETVDGPGRTRKILRSCSLLDAHGEPANFVPLGGRFHLRIGVDSALSVDYPSLAINIDDQMGQRVLTLQTPLSHPVIENMLGQGVIDCVVDPFPLAPGDYWIRLAVWQVPDALDEVDRVLRFTVTPGEAFGSGRGFQSGVCIAPSHWTFERRSE